MRTTAQKHDLKRRIAKVALNKAKSPGKKRGVVALGIRNVYMCLVLTADIGKCVCYRSCGGGVRHVITSKCVGIRVCG